MHGMIQNGRQQGFSLVEVLIALVIMSIGMLGIAGLYVQSLQAGRTSMFRHNAVIVAADVADRIRANRNGGIAYEDPVGNYNYCDQEIECDEAAMAANDVWLFQEQARTTLPEGEVEITFDDTVTPWQYTIRVVWQEPGEELDYSVVIPVMGGF